MASYLEGENQAPLTVKKVRDLVGKRVEYLRRSDIDRSGRGYFFPQTGLVISGAGRNIEIGEQQFYSFSEIVEIVERASA